MADAARERPPAGRRPAGRRAQIVLLAADRFHRGGYHQVSMADIAEGVGITAPALYRHFRGKPELLHQVIRSGTDALAAGVGAAGSVDGLCRALAGVAIDHRALGTLWQRDARLLPPALRAGLRRDLRADVRLMASTLRAERPGLPSFDAELLCWSALSVYGALSHHTFAPPRRRFEGLLTAIGSALLAVSFDGARPEPPLPAPAAVPRQRNRREELLAVAVQLFHERGFDNVSTGELGAAVGIAGPSVYRHFDTKAALLAASLVRCRERLWHEVEAAITGAAAGGAAPDGDPAGALAAGLRAYIGFARRNRHYLGAMLSETERLAPADRRAAVDFRRDFLRTWVGLLRQVRPGYDNAEARIRVHSMFALVNDGVRNGPQSARADLADCLERMSLAVLGL
ncbi:TetR/AcrR family transcriptional regulator [Kitasatospora sp. NBC_00315]|uniref:TetR/AcrR family transcriptional regulator n=1 Tax=Kitasatospora sp. NBC_00315 TaxID=2975963 RepID=UPI0032499015